MCTSIYEDYVQWPAVPALTVGVSGQCEIGYQGAPSRSCDASGMWEPIQSPCLRTIWRFLLSLC